MGGVVGIPDLGDGIGVVRGKVDKREIDDRRQGLCDNQQAL